MEFEEPQFSAPEVCGLCHRIKVNSICRHCDRPRLRYVQVCGPGGSGYSVELPSVRDSPYVAREVRRALLPVLDIWLDPTNDYHLLADEKIAWATHARASLRAGAMPKHPRVYMPPGLAERFIEQATRRGVPRWIFGRMPARK